MNHIPLNDQVVFFQETHSATTAQVTNADVVPDFEVWTYSNVLGTPITRVATTSMTQVATRVGTYFGVFGASSSGGFAKGDWANVVMTATVGGIVGKYTAMTFRVAAPEHTVGYPVVGLDDTSFNAQAVSKLATAVWATGSADADGRTVHVVQLNKSVPAAIALRKMLDGTGETMTLTQLRIVATSSGGGIDIDNSGGDAINATSSAANGNGMTLGGGSTSGVGLRAQGAPSGYGINASGLIGILGTSPTSGGSGIAGQAATGTGILGQVVSGSGNGIAGFGSGSGSGFSGIGAGSGSGLSVLGGATGPGFTAAAGGGNANGATFTPSGTGYAIQAVNAYIDGVTVATMSAAATASVADGLLNRDLAMGSSGNTRNVQNALRVLRNRVNIATNSSTGIVYQEDDASTAWTFAVATDSGTDRVTGIDPI